MVSLMSLFEYLKVLCISWPIYRHVFLTLVAIVAETEIKLWTITMHVAFYCTGCIDHLYHMKWSMFVYYATILC